MPKSTGGAQYSLMIVHDATNTSWPVFRPDVSAAIVTNVFPTFSAAVNAYGTPVYLRTHNRPEFTNRKFQKLMPHNDIRREYTSVDSPKRNGRVERKLARVGGRVVSSQGGGLWAHMIGVLDMDVRRA